MKKITTLLLLLVVCTMNAQYELTVLNETYENLEDATSLNNGEIWDDPSFVVPLGFDFQYGSTIINTLFFSDDNVGGIVSTDDGTNGIPFGVIAPVGQDIIDRGSNTGTSLSPISFVVEGEAGSQIAKIEWNNVGFFEESSLQDFMNFQLWLYEEDNSIEFRYGSSEINDPANSFEDLGGVQAGFILLFDQGVNELLEDAYILSGDTQGPELLILTTTEELDDIGDVALIGAVPDGTVYRFSNEALSVDDVNTNPVDFSVYPNPTNDIFKIESKEVDYKLEVYNTSGQQVMNFDSPRDSYNISNLSEGIYFVKIQSLTGVVTKRLIKS